MNTSIDYIVSNTNVLVKQNMYDINRPTSTKLLRAVRSDSGFVSDIYEAKKLNPYNVDAEAVLLELGFAGCTNPTIPDRFIPSLMDRISSLPASAIKSLDQRILQSLNFFQKRENRRKLFRNLSLGRENSEVSSSEVKHKGYPTFGHRLKCEGFSLVRSLTGPADFSEEKINLSSSNGLKNKEVTCNPEMTNLKVSSPDEITDNIEEKPSDNITHVAESLINCEIPAIVCTHVDSTENISFNTSNFENSNSISSSVNEQDFNQQDDLYIQTSKNISNSVLVEIKNKDVSSADSANCDNFSNGDICNNGTNSTKIKDVEVDEIDFDTNKDLHREAGSIVEIPVPAAGFESSEFRETLRYQLHSAESQPTNNILENDISNTEADQNCLPNPNKSHISLGNNCVKENTMFLPTSALQKDVQAQKNANFDQIHFSDYLNSTDRNTKPQEFSASFSSKETKNITDYSNNCVKKYTSNMEPLASENTSLFEEHQQNKFDSTNTEESSSVNVKKKSLSDCRKIFLSSLLNAFQDDEHEHNITLNNNSIESPLDMQFVVKEKPLSSRNLKPVSLRKQSLQKSISFDESEHDDYSVDLNYECKENNTAFEKNASHITPTLISISSIKNEEYSINKDKLTNDLTVPPLDKKTGNLLENFGKEKQLSDSINNNYNKHKKLSDISNFTLESNKTESPDNSKGQVFNLDFRVLNNNRYVEKENDMIQNYYFDNNLRKNGLDKSSIEESINVKKIVKSIQSSKRNYEMKSDIINKVEINIKTRLKKSASYPQALHKSYPFNDRCRLLKRSHSVPFLKKTSSKNELFGNHICYEEIPNTFLAEIKSELLSKISAFVNEQKNKRLLRRNYVDYPSEKRSVSNHADGLLSEFCNSTREDNKDKIFQHACEGQSNFNNKYKVGSLARNINRSNVEIFPGIQRKRSESFMNSISKPEIKEKTSCKSSCFSELSLFAPLKRYNEKEVSDKDQCFLRKEQLKTAIFSKTEQSKNRNSKHFHFYDCFHKPITEKCIGTQNETNFSQNTKSTIFTDYKKKSDKLCLYQCCNPLQTNKNLKNSDSLIYSSCSNIPLKCDQNIIDSNNNNHCVTKTDNPNHNSTVKLKTKRTLETLKSKTNLVFHLLEKLKKHPSKCFRESSKYDTENSFKQNKNNTTINRTELSSERNQPDKKSSSQFLSLADIERYASFPNSQIRCLLSDCETKNDSECNRMSEVSSSHNSSFSNDKSIIFRRNSPALTSGQLSIRNRTDDSIKKFTSGFRIPVNDEGQQKDLSPIYFSSVYMEINKDEATRSSNDGDCETSSQSCLSQRLHVEKVSDKSKELESPFQKASRDLEELRIAIQKAKATRVSASRELHYLQEILQGNTDCEKDHKDCDVCKTLEPAKSSEEISSKFPTQKQKSKDFSLPYKVESRSSLVETWRADDLERLKKQVRYVRRKVLEQERRLVRNTDSFQRELFYLREKQRSNEALEQKAEDRLAKLSAIVTDLQLKATRIQEALSELQQRVKNTHPENSTFWEDRIKEVKEEISQECQKRLSEMESQLKEKDARLSVLLDENKKLRQHVEERTSVVSAYQCSPININNCCHRLDDSSCLECRLCDAVKLSCSTRCQRQDCMKLQENLRETELRADNLNLLLNQKLIELNKLQLTLSKQTKEMIQIEKAYFQLRWHLSCGFRKSSPNPWSSSPDSSRTPSAFSTENIPMLNGSEYSAV